jgi:hypothetical protein
MMLFAALHMSACSTLRPMACLVECPQSAKADERRNPKSQFDPEPPIGGRLCCNAQRSRLLNVIGLWSSV